jgi:ABC-type amino acid transport system permease subunit
MRSRDCCAAASAATTVMLAAIAYATAAHSGFFVKLMETPDFDLVGGCCIGLMSRFFWVAEE